MPANFPCGKFESTTMLDTKHNNLDLETSLHRLNITNRTLLFKAHIKTIRTRNKALGTNDPKSPQTNILPRTGHNDSVKTCFMRSKEIYTQITKLLEFLNENKNVYLHPKTNILDDATNSINDKEKEKIDIETQKIIKIIKTRIYELKRLVESNEKVYSEQLFQHYNNVANYSDAYLKKVIALYISMKQDNEKRNEKYLNMFKLGNDRRGKLCEQLEPAGNSNVSFDNASFIEDIEKHQLNENEYGDLSPEELQTFKNENDSLFKHLTNLTEEVEQIESKVLKVAELQQQLTENLYDQAQTVENTLGAFVGTTENIKEGNEQLRQAIQGSATLRLFVILILLVLSFSILFLDWFND
uniref:Syntaxin-18 n=2 Tax=Cacopsylla melanoneura TaxID=428564 RepID=A0A8D8WHK1_9HEMI